MPSTTYHLRFMGSYVLLERQNLEEMLGKLSQEEDIADSSQGDGAESSSSSSASSAYGNVYNSSTSMFVFIKNSIKRCTALSNGHTFLLLCKEFQNCLAKYCDLLKSRCPTPIVQLSAITGMSTSFTYINILPLHTNLVY